MWNSSNNVLLNWTTGFFWILALIKWPLFRELAAVVPVSRYAATGLALIALSSSCIICLITCAQGGFTECRIHPKPCWQLITVYGCRVYSMLQLLEWFIFALIVFALMCCCVVVLFCDRVLPLSADDNQVFINRKAKGNPHTSLCSSIFLFESRYSFKAMFYFFAVYNMQYVQYTQLTAEK